MATLRFDRPRTPASPCSFPTSWPHTWPGRPGRAAH